MMGCLKSDQGQLFYEFHLNDAVPEDHLVRKIDAALDLSWLRGELAPHYSSMGRPSIDPELMIRMLVVGYVFAIRSERLISSLNFICRPQSETNFTRRMPWPGQRCPFLM
jgi:transposase